MGPALRWLVLAYVVCALIWGTTFYGIRACVGPHGYPLYESLALRFGAAALILLPFALRVRPWPRDRVTWGWLVVAGLLDALGYVLVYEGEQHVAGGLAAVVFGAQPLIMALLLVLTRSERISRSDLIGAIVSLAGVGVMFLDRTDVSWQQGVGLLLCFASTAVSTVYLLLTKKKVGDTHPLVVTTVFIGVTALALVLVVLVRGPEPLPWPLPLMPTLALVHLTVAGSVIAFAAYFWLQARVSLMVTGTLVFVFPLIALLVDRVAERELALELRAYLGIAVTLGGLAISLDGRRRAMRAAQRVD